MRRGPRRRQLPRDGRAGGAMSAPRATIVSPAPAGRGPADPRDARGPHRHDPGAAGPETPRGPAGAPRTDRATQRRLPEPGANRGRVTPEPSMTDMSPLESTYVDIALRQVHAATEAARS